MSSFNSVIIIIFLSISLFSCSSVDFYDVNISSDDDAGFLYYPPKPYLVIEKGTDGITTKLISLPDLSRPHRVKHSEGFGTAEMGFVIENGMINSFNSKSDSKTSEAVTSLSGIGTAQAALITAKATLEAARAANTKELSYDVVNSNYKVVAVNESISEVVKVKDFLENASKHLGDNSFTNEIDLLSAEANKLSKLLLISYDRSKPDDLINDLEGYRKKAGSVVNELSGILSSLNSIVSNPTEFPYSYSYAIKAKSDLVKPISKLNGFSSRSASVVGLYEIDFIAGKLKLRKVTLE